jgi:hypothetical protein
MKAFILLLSVFCLSVSLYAQDTTRPKADEGFKINGKIRIRPELDGRDFFNKTYPVTFTTARSRLSVDKTLFGSVQFFLQLQDSRVLGEEKNLQGSIKNTDLHQGYIVIKNILDIPLSAQAGKFEMSYGSERFIGLGNWGYIGRTFDGLRVSLATEPYKVDLFSITQNSSVSTPVSPDPNIYPVNQAFDPSLMIYGLWNSFRFLEDMPFDVFGYYEFNGNKTDKKTNDLQRYTAGLSYNPSFGDFSLTLEGAFQGGQKNDRIDSATFRLKDISAYTASLLLSYKVIKPLAVSLGYDIISGTDPKDSSTKVNTYNQNLGTGHKFYGYMDYFTDMPKHTANLGVNDLYLMLKYGNNSDKLSGQVNAHYFTSNKKSADNLNVFGQELDLVLNYAIVKGASVQWGGSLFGGAAAAGTVAASAAVPAFSSTSASTSDLVTFLPATLGRLSTESL